MGLDIRLAVGVLWVGLSLQGDVARLVEKLSSERVAERAEAEQALKALGKAAIPNLTAAARGADSEQALRARAILRWIQRDGELSPRVKSILPGIVDRLVSDEKAAAAVLLEVVARSQKIPTESDRPTGEDLGPLLLPALRSDVDPSSLFQVCVVAAECGFRSAAPDLVALLGHRDSIIRTAAADALEALRVPESSPGLRKGLSDPDAAVRGSCAIALGCLRDVDARAVLQALLSDGDENVRWKAAMALGLSGAKEARAGIVKLSNDPSELVRILSLQALNLLGAPCEEKELLPALESENPELRRVALKTAGDLGCRPAIPRIRSLLKDPQARVRAAAALALGLLGAEDATPDLLAALKDPEDDAKAAAAKALALLQRREATPNLQELLKESNPVVRGAAAEALCSLGSSEAVGTIVEQGIALEFLNALKSPTAWKALEKRRVFRNDRGPLKEVLENAAKSAGFSIVWDQGCEIPGTWRAGSPDMSSRKSDAEFLQQMLGDRCTFIFDAGRIRVLPMSDAAAAWREWAKQR